MEVAAGAVHLKGRLPLAEQRVLVDACRSLVDGAVPAYVPVVRGGGKMHVRMLCLGRHWNGRVYRYEESRSDYDRLPVPPLPAAFRDLARGIAASAGMGLDADLCILNYYEAGGRMGCIRTRTRVRSRWPPACRSCRSRLATRRGFYLEGCAAAIRSKRCFSNLGTPLSLAAQPGCAITACRGFCRRPPRPNSV